MKPGRASAFVFGANRMQYRLKRHPEVAISDDDILSPLASFHLCSTTTVNLTFSFNPHIADEVWRLNMSQCHIYKLPNEARCRAQISTRHLLILCRTAASAFVRPTADT